jgi:hypothetical protein
MALTKVDISLMDNTGTTANKLLAYDGSGNLPAVDGSQLTNVGTGILESTSDPTLSTNPSGGVGTQWNNKTSGEVYICTDATAGSNVWTNVGAGTGNVNPWQWGGESFGFLAGGHTSSRNTIQKFSFASDGNATDLADTSVSKSYAAGSMSQTHGYVGSGNPGSPTVEKYAFVSTANSASIGNITDGITACDATTDSNYSWYASITGSGSGQISKHTHSSESFAANSSDCVNANSGRTGAYASTTYGYWAGGIDNNSTTGRKVEKVQFSSDTVSTSVTTMYQGGYGMAGASSSTHGYVAGGNCSGCGGTGNWIQKRSFASEGAMTDVGDATTSRESGAGLSSLTYGYHAGGGPYQTTIDKWSFASDGNATDVGDMVVSVSSPAPANY